MWFGCAIKRHKLRRKANTASEATALCLLHSSDYTQGYWAMQHAWDGKCSQRGQPSDMAS
jgi:hypothetical protein